MLAKINSPFSFVVTNQLLGATISFFYLENRLCGALQLDDYLPAANQLCSTDTLDTCFCSLSESDFCTDLSNTRPQICRTSQ